MLITNNDLKQLYSNNQSNKNKEHMDKLFPNIQDGCINFGYWETYAKPIPLLMRINSQKSLYEKVFTKLNLLKNKKVLEVGFGRGHGIKWLNEKNIDCYGIDAFDEHVSLAKKCHPKLSKKYIFGEAENIPFEDNFFDAVYTIEAAQHFTSFKNFIKESHRVLNKNGILCISTYFFNAEAYKKNVEQFIPTSIEGTHNAISIEKAKKSLEKMNFIIEEFQSIGENVFPAYAEWQKQQFQSEIQLKHFAKEKKWEKYFIGGGNNEHPWLTVYKNKWIDYFIIKVRKNYAIEVLAKFFCS